MSNSASCDLPAKLVMSRKKPPRDGRRNSNHGHTTSRTRAKYGRQSALWLWSSRFKITKSMITTSTARLSKYLAEICYSEPMPNATSTATFSKRLDPLVSLVMGLGSHTSCSHVTALKRSRRVQAVDDLLLWLEGCQLISQKPVESPKIMHIIHPLTAQPWQKLAPKDVVGHVWRSSHVLGVAQQDCTQHDLRAGCENYQNYPFCTKPGRVSSCPKPNANVRLTSHSVGSKPATLKPFKSKPQ